MNNIANIITQLATLIDDGKYNDPQHAVLILVDSKLGINIIGMGENGDEQLPKAIILKTGALLTADAVKPA